MGWCLVNFDGSKQGIFQYHKHNSVQIWALGKYQLKFLCSINCVCAVSNNRVLSLVCEKQSIALEISQVLWGLSWYPLPITQLNVTHCRTKGFNMCEDIQLRLFLLHYFMMYFRVFSYIYLFLKGSIVFDFYVSPQMTLNFSGLSLKSFPYFLFLPYFI